ncbi:MAG: riboflavin synthase, partial [Bacteroidia bacterium]|nr:riboflavin synthase [Bacteroidia bacterium]
MFTGIIESTGTVKNIISEDTNKHFVIEADIASELKIDQSVSHNGVCLTVVAVNDYQYTVTAIDETLKRTNLNELTIGSIINLERCMPVNGRFDGHIVQGHVDDTAQCVSIKDNNGSWLFTFQLKNNQYNNLIVDKGSICINGISLT